MEHNKRPSLEECFSIIDKAIDNEAKQLIINTDPDEVPYTFHFTLGMWIRNEIITRYDLRAEDLFIVKDAIDSLLLNNPDAMSGQIILHYQQHLISQLS